VDARNVRYARTLWRCGDIREGYRGEMGMRLLQYYADRDMVDALDEFLPLLAPEHLSGKERAEVVRYMIQRGMYDGAFALLERYGAEHVPRKSIVRLCSSLLPRRDFQESGSMTALSYFAFRKGKYDENLLHYLGLYFQGGAREMGALWCACQRFEAVSYELCERLVLQMLLTGEFIQEEEEVLLNYLAGSANEALVEGYLSHAAYRYFIQGHEPAPFIWRELERRSRNGETQKEICELALLTHFDGLGLEALDEGQREMCREYLEDLALEKGILLGFFKNFAQLCPALASYGDKTFLEYRDETENALTLHYIVCVPGQSGRSGTVEFGKSKVGVYTRSFLLFSGESLHYYITEKKGQKDVLVKDGELQAGSGTRGHLGRINCMIEAAGAGKWERALRTLEEYRQTEFAVEELFTLL